MSESVKMVSLWKTSTRGKGGPHLISGYPESDFPGRSSEVPDGCAYFALDRWIAEEFASPRLLGYEDWIIEVRIKVGIYEEHFRQFEQPFVSESGIGRQVVIPNTMLQFLNENSLRFSFVLQD